MQCLQQCLQSLSDMNITSSLRSLLSKKPYFWTEHFPGELPSILRVVPKFPSRINS